MKTGCWVGWADITKTLLDVYLLSSNLAVENLMEETATERPPVVTIRSSALYVGVEFIRISSLTWAGGVAYPIRLAAKARTRDEQG